MSNDDSHGDPVADSTFDSEAGLRAKIEGLEADLALARSAAAQAEAEQGRLQGELIKVNELWAAACHAQQEWDVLLSENVEALRLARERAEAADRRRSQIEHSTTWRMSQAMLAPYRRLRGIR